MRHTQGGSARRLDDYAARIVDRAARQLTPADLRDGQVRLHWYSITDQAERATLYIYDEIGGSFGVDAQQFAEDLRAVTAPRIDVRINSPGGALFDGIAIHNSIASHPATVAVFVDSLAASIASIIAMAGDEVVMMPGAQIMIHDALAITMGNAADHQAMSTFLDRQSDNLAEIYQGRAGGEVAEWRERMLDETWMFASEAVELGLADRVARRGEEPDDEGDDEGDDAAAAAQDIDELMSRAHSLARFRYAGRAAAPPPERRPQKSTNAATTVDIDKVRDALRGALR